MASPFALPFSPRPFSPLLPLEVGPLLRLGVWGSAYKLPQLVRAKPRRQYRRLLVHIQPIWAYFGKHFRAISPWYFCGGGDFAGDSNDSQYSAGRAWHHWCVGVSQCVYSVAGSPSTVS